MATAVPPLAPRPSPPAADDLLTLTQACRYAQVSRRTLYNWMQKGRVTRYETASGSPRVRRGDLVHVEESA